MKIISLQFKDAVRLMEFINTTRLFYCATDLQEAIITCELTEAQIELAVNGYEAAMIET